MYSFRFPILPRKKMLQRLFSFNSFRSQSNLVDNDTPPLTNSSPSPPFSRRLRWKPTSEEELEYFEKEMLSVIDIDYKQTFVEIDKNHFINTLIIGSGPPLVLFHGFAGGIGFWNSNLKELAKNNTVYCIDLPGFGRSSRVPFTENTPEASEKYFLTAIHKWFEKMGFSKKVRLLGHSFGAYLCACYALKHPDQIQHLILADPWGIPEKPNNFEQNLSFKFKVILKFITYFNPLSIIRFVGPMGPSLITRFRSDIEEKFSHLFPERPGIVSSYIYHLNAQKPTGETAFHHLSVPIGWSKKPLVNRIQDLDPSIFVSFIYGQYTWMDKNIGKHLSQNQLASRSEYYTIGGSGHHVYVDNYQQFNSLIQIITSRESLNNEEIIIPI